MCVQDEPQLPAPTPCGHHGQHTTALHPLTGTEGEGSGREDPPPTPLHVGN